MGEVKNIIFDLGGVIINLDVIKTISIINSKSTQKLEALYNEFEQDELFNDFDKGLLNSEAFFKRFKQKINFIGTDLELLNAWNAMILDVPEKRIDLLVSLKQKYNTFLLSNTCEPHITCFERSLYLQNGIKNFEDYFDKIYFSCRIGMRKPDKEIFEFVLEENKLKAEETIFIDDTMRHVKGAGDCGIKSYLLTKNQEVGDLLKELNLI